MTVRNSMPRRPAAPKNPKNDSFGSVMAVVTILAVLGAVGYGGFMAWKYRHLFLPKEHEAPKIIEVTEERKPEPKPVEKVDLPVEPEPSEPAPPPKKTVEEMRAEMKPAVDAFESALAAARAKGAKDLSGFAGVAFGSVVKGTPVRTEELPSGGLLLEMQGPALKKPLMAFKGPLYLWVTPKTHKVCRIELQAVLAKRADETLAAETTNAIAVLSAKLHREPLSVDALKYPLAEREFVFPIGNTTLKIGEYGGTRLVLSVEHGGLLAAAKSETDLLHDETIGDQTGGGALGSSKYPNGGPVKGKYVRMRDGTPKSFCGVVFGTMPPLGAKRSQTSRGESCFYLDYRKTKANPFLGFSHGKAAYARISGGVYAVDVHCECAEDGLTDDEYLDKVTKIIMKHYKTKPKVTDAATVFNVGDVEITLAREKTGGFSLRAVNSKLPQF